MACLGKTQAYRSVESTTVTFDSDSTVMDRMPIGTNTTTARRVQDKAPDTLEYGCASETVW